MTAAVGRLIKLTGVDLAAWQAAMGLTAAFASIVSLYVNGIGLSAPAVQEGSGS